MIFNDTTLKMTSRSGYAELIQKKNSSVEDIYAIAHYPYIPLAELCENLACSERKGVKEIEDLNIYYFIKTFKIVFGLGTPRETETFHRALVEEPLRTAVILGRIETNPTEKLITFFTTAVRVLLSPKDGGNRFFRNPINVGIVGSMPRQLFKSRQSIGNMWYETFVNIKLDLMARICRVMDVEEVFPIMLTSVAYSLYYYTPSRYPISNKYTEKENVSIILQKFTEHVRIIKNKS